MIKRILVAVFLAWMAIAPAIANSCATGCETGASSAHHHAPGGPADAHSQDVPDCPDDSNSPDRSSMEVACLVAGAASLPSSSLSLARIERVSEQHAAVLLPPLSFQTSAPARPPQA
ncbi:MAG TPA: hypothetical protein VGE08_17870 [Steroidobacter sp.]|uniref:hypothetical protein n=1 Tax=Steroidobacter sp. TaxID=1978227 RepID=UPI002ED9A0C4